jgi:hypothetical protein
MATVTAATPRTMAMMPRTISKVGGEDAELSAVASSTEPGVMGVLPSMAEGSFCDGWMCKVFWVVRTEERGVRTRKYRRGNGRFLCCLLPPFHELVRPTLNSIPLTNVGPPCHNSAAREVIHDIRCGSARCCGVIYSYFIAQVTYLNFTLSALS